MTNFCSGFPSCSPGAVLLTPVRHMLCFHTHHTHGLWRALPLSYWPQYSVVHSVIFRGPGQGRAPWQDHSSISFYTDACSRLSCPWASRTSQKIWKSLFSVRKTLLLYWSIVVWLVYGPALISWCGCLGTHWRFRFHTNWMRNSVVLIGKNVCEKPMYLTYILWIYLWEIKLCLIEMNYKIKVVWVHTMYQQRNEKTISERSAKGGIAEGGRRQGWKRRNK